MLQQIMENYLSDKPKEVNNTNPSLTQPIEISKGSWSVLEKKMKKSFKFDLRKQKEAFILELLKFARESIADIEIRTRMNTVGVILHAQAPHLSEIEVEASNDINKINKDVSYYFAKKE